ncbi:MAG: NUDIX domain-containing protein [Patescibacteria group bacterium]|nr:NUDIX domain-containing protein [Patescibacteria group bacterium]
MIKIFYKLIIPLRKFYWFIFRPKTTGVKVIVKYNEDVLMIKNAYGKSIWTFPGGAVEKSELPEDAAAREVMEEVGIKVSGVKKIGQLLNTREYKKDTIYCYVAITTGKTVQTDPNEIRECKWFNKNKLPSEISSIAREAISLWTQKLI